jgi:hypothetical protein
VGAEAELDRSVGVRLADKPGAGDDDVSGARDDDPRAVADDRRVVTEPVGVERDQAGELLVGPFVGDRGPD